MYQVKLICRNDEGHILVEKLSQFEWDTRDAAQMFGISQYEKVLERNEHVDYIVTAFIIISNDKQ